MGGRLRRKGVGLGGVCRRLPLKSPGELCRATPAKLAEELELSPWVEGSAQKAERGAGDPSCCQVSPPRLRPLFFASTRRSIPPRGAGSPDPWAGRLGDPTLAQIVRANESRSLGARWVVFGSSAVLGCQGAVSGAARRRVL